MTEETEKKLAMDRTIAWGFLIFLFAVFSYVGILAMIESYRKGFMYRPYFWLGLVFWVFFGFFYYEISVFLKKRGGMKLGLLIIFLGYFLYHLSKRMIILGEFLVPVGFTPLVAIIRGLVYEKRV